MRLRTKLLLSHGLIALSMGVVCVLCVFALTVADRSRAQLRTTTDELHALSTLGTEVNDFAEQIAELFPMGADDAAIREKDEARDELAATFDALSAEARALLAEEGPATERRFRLEDRLAWLSMARESMFALDRVADRIVAAIREGDVAQASRLYSVEVEDSLDALISRQIEGAIDLESLQVAATVARSERITRLTWLVALTVVALGATAAVANALVLSRLVSRPVAELARDVDALAADAGLPPAPPGQGDELAQLAARFSAMAIEIRGQRLSLSQARDSLAAQVAERTARLDARTRELEQANGRLTELNETRVQFFADISHELRTPLTVLRGHAEVAARNPRATREDLVATLDLLVDKAEQLGRLVDELLFVARSESGMLQVDRRAVPAHEVMAEALADAGSLRREGDVTLAARVPDVPVVVDADPQRLRQAMVILLDNAIRHSPQGGSVTAELAADDGGIVFSVSDQGPGFSPSERAHAFERFFRGRRFSGGRGAGLGLSIARWIVERHGGRIWIDERDGPGARVSFWIAACAREAAA